MEEFVDFGDFGGFHLFVVDGGEDFLEVGFFDAFEFGEFVEEGFVVAFDQVEGGVVEEFVNFVQEADGLVEFDDVGEEALGGDEVGEDFFGVVEGEDDFGEGVALGIPFAADAGVNGFHLFIETLLLHPVA